MFAESLEVTHETPEFRETQTEYQWNSGFKALRVTTRLIMETSLNFLRGSLRSLALNRIILENLKIVQLFSKWTAFRRNNTPRVWFPVRIRLSWLRLFVIYLSYSCTIRGIAMIMRRMFPSIILQNHQSQSSCREHYTVWATDSVNTETKINKKINGAFKLPVNANDVNLFHENICTTKKNTEAV